MPLFERVGLAERYDIAIMSTKGMSVTAARKLIEAGHHGFLGAVSGCISGRHTAKRRSRAHPTNSVPPDASKTPK